MPCSAWLRGDDGWVTYGISIPLFNIAGVRDAVTGFA